MFEALSLVIVGFVAMLKDSLAKKRSKRFLDRVQSCLKAAQIAGTIEPFDTVIETVSEEGISFEVRVASSLIKKPGRAPDSKPRDPFMPPFEAGMLVDDTLTDHRVLLNKFNVLPVHLLVTSKSFRHQDGPLRAEDFAVTASVLEATGDNSLAFYNHGHASGFSQPHLHIQVVDMPNFPLLNFYNDPVLRNKLGFNVGVDQVPCDEISPYSKLEETVNSLLNSLKLSWQSDQGFNLLWNRTMVIVIPRSRSELEPGLCLNAISYSGSLFVKNEQISQRLKQVGPLKLLRSLSTI